MRYVMIVLLSLAPTVVVCQTFSGGNSLPPGLIDGSKNPGLIPDYAAYRLVLLSLQLPASPDQNAISRQNAKLARIGLSKSDTQALSNLIAGFSVSYSQWLTAAGVHHDDAAEQRVQALVLTTRDSILKILSHGGATSFAQYVEREKAHMVVRP